MTSERLSVLLVEDVRDNSLLAELVLRRGGFDVTAVRTGEQAIAALDQGKYDVVALDLILPDVDGLGLAGRLRAAARLAGAPIIAITALAMKGDRERALEAGCDEYLTKPVDTRTLAEEVARIVEEYRKAGTAGTAMMNDE